MILAVFLPQWAGVLERNERFPVETDNASIVETQERINRLPYVPDPDGIWKAPVDFYREGGDCEDFAIAKYFALRHLGVDNLTIVLGYDTKKRLRHAVLKAKEWWLDIEGPPVKALPNFQPIIGFNELTSFQYPFPPPTRNRKSGPSDPPAEPVPPHHRIR